MMGTAHADADEWTPAVDAWVQAVELGARGRYLPAWHRLDLIDDRDAVASLAHSTRGSHFRQIGMVDLARQHDERAVELARDALATGDAWIGLAADAIADGAVEEATQHLERMDDLLSGLGPADGVVQGSVTATAASPIKQPDQAMGAALQPWRTRVRASWVRSELALLEGDARTAIDQARVAIDASRPHSIRHRVKSEAILAAGLVSSGQAGEAATICDRLGVQVRQHGWVSLMWPVALIAVAAGQVDPGGEGERAGDPTPELVRQGAWATRLIRAHLPDGRDRSRWGDLVSRWQEHPDAALLRALADR